jgi:hypothetical protein
MPCFLRALFSSPRNLFDMSATHQIATFCVETYLLRVSVISNCATGTFCLQSLHSLVTVHGLGAGEDKTLSFYMVPVFLRRRTNCSIQKLWHDAHVSIPCYVYALINLHIIWCWIKIFHQPEILPFGDDSRYNPWSMVTSQRRRYNSAKYIQIYVYYEIMYIIYFITCIYSIKWVSLKIGYFKIRWIIIFPIRMTLLDVTIFSHTHISLSEESNKTTSGHCSLKPYRTSLRLEGQAEDYYRRCCSEHGRRGWRNQKQTKQTAWNLHRSA